MPPQQDYNASTAEDITKHLKTLQNILHWWHFGASDIESITKHSAKDEGVPKRY